MITAEELLSSFRKPVIVKLDSVIAPEIKNKYYITNSIFKEATFKNNIICITQMKSYSDTAINIIFQYKDGAQDSFYIPFDFKMTILDGEERDNFMSNVKKFIKENLHLKLNHSGSVAAIAQFFIENENGDCILPSSFLPVKNDPCNSYYDTTFCIANEFTAQFTTTANVCLASTIDSMACGLKKIHDRKPNKSAISLSSIKEVDEKPIPFPRNEKNISNAYGLKRSSSKDKSRAARTSLKLELYGFNNLSASMAEPIVKAIDSTLGVMCVSLFAGLRDKNKVTVGGMPGDYSICPGSLDYWALDNYWMIHPMAANLVFDLARKCAIFGKNEFTYLWEASEEEVISCMMNNDVKAAHTIMSRNKEVIMNFFKAAWPVCTGSGGLGIPNLGEIKPEIAREVIYDIFYNGIAQYIKNIEDITENWTLNGTWTTHSEGDGKNVWRTINSMLGTKVFPNKIIWK